MAGEKPAECSGSLAGDLNFQAPLRGEPADHGWFVGGGSRAARQTVSGEKQPVSGEKHPRTVKRRCNE